MSKFNEFILNEIYKLKGKVENMTLEEKLEVSYEIIKSQPKIYKKFHDNNFFRAFITANKTLVFEKDKADLISLIDFSYIVLHDKEDIKEEYFSIKREIRVLKEDKPIRKFTKNLGDLK